MNQRAPGLLQLLRRTGIVLLLIGLGYTTLRHHGSLSRLKPTWRVQSSMEVPIANGLTLFTLSLKRESEEFQCLLARFEESEFELLVLDNGPSRATPRFRNLKDALHRTGCLAGTNGGFFDLGTFAPNGVMIASGVQTGEFQRDNWAAGVVVVRDQRPSLELRDVFLPVSSVTQVLQTGPWLVREGKALGGFDADTAAHRRTFIATDGRESWLLGHVSGSTLSDLGEILCGEALATILPVRDALNLDGGPSSAFLAQAPGSAPIYIEEATIVRNFLGLRPRLSPE